MTHHAESFYLQPSVLKLKVHAAAAIENYGSGKPPSTTDTQDILPGILSNPTVIPNALFPVTLERCIPTGAFSLSQDVSPSTVQPSTAPQDVNATVYKYLKNLQSELDMLAAQRPSTSWNSVNPGGSADMESLTDNSGTVSSNIASTDATHQYLPPSMPLLSSVPPFTGESQMVPFYDPTLWSSFMSSLGSLS